MTVRRAILALLQATPGKGVELQAFLESARALALAEEGTVTWYAFRLDETSLGIFDTFEASDQDARQTHLNGKIPAVLAAVVPGLLAAHPESRLVEIIAVK